MLDDEAAPTKEVFAESKEEEKMEEVEGSSEGCNEDLYTGSRIFRRPPPTVSNENKCAGNGFMVFTEDRKSVV